MDSKGPKDPWVPWDNAFKAVWGRAILILTGASQRNWRKESAVDSSGLRVESSYCFITAGMFLAPSELHLGGCPMCPWVPQEMQWPHDRQELQRSQGSKVAKALKRAKRSIGPWCPWPGCPCNSWGARPRRSPARVGLLGSGPWAPMLLRSAAPGASRAPVTLGPWSPWALMHPVWLSGRLGPLAA